MWAEDNDFLLGVTVLLSGSLTKLAKAPCHDLYFGRTADTGIQFIQTFDLSRRIVGIKTGVIVFPPI